VLRQVQIRDAVVDRCPGGDLRPLQNEGVGWTTECLRLPPTVLLAAVPRRQVLFCSLRCIVDGVHLMIMRQMRLICRRQNIFRLLKLGGFAMVACCVLMMFCRIFVKFA
jgi:hypothetical protein